MSWARVQGNSTDATANAGTVAVTISAVGLGNTICGIVSADNVATPTLNSVTDDKFNTYNLETKIIETADAQACWAFSLTNITNAPTVITANFNVNPAFRKILVDEFSGGSTASTDERDVHTGQYQSAPGTGTDGISSGAVTTTVNGDLLYGGVIIPNTTAAPTRGTSFSDGTSNTTTYLVKSEYRVQTTAGASTVAAFTQGTANATVAFLIALKPAAGGVSPNTPYNPWPMLAPILAQ